jgi:hypothetical protein
VVFRLFSSGIATIIEGINIFLIHDAVAVRHLRSGDIIVTLKDQQAKERAVRAGDRLGERIGIKVLCEDHPVEVLAVPTSLRVEKGRQADNIAMIREIVK